MNDIRRKESAVFCEGQVPWWAHRRNGMVQKGPFSGNTWDLSAHSERFRAGAGFGESLVAAPGLQFWENRVYPRSSSQ